MHGVNEAMRTVDALKNALLLLFAADGPHEERAQDGMHLGRFAWGLRGTGVHECRRDERYLRFGLWVRRWDKEWEIRVALCVARREVKECGGEAWDEQSYDFLDGLWVLHEYQQRDRRVYGNYGPPREASLLEGRLRRDAGRDRGRPRPIQHATLYADPPLARTPMLTGSRLCAISALE